MTGRPLPELESAYGPVFIETHDALLVGALEGAKTVCPCCTRDVVVHEHRLRWHHAVWLGDVYEKYGREPFHLARSVRRWVGDGIVAPSGQTALHHVGALDRQGEVVESCATRKCPGTAEEPCRRAPHVVRDGVYTITDLGQAWIRGTATLPVGYASYDGKPWRALPVRISFADLLGSAPATTEALH